MSLVKGLIKAGGGAEKFFAGGIEAAREAVRGSEKLAGAKTHTINSHLKNLEKEFSAYSSTQKGIQSVESMQAKAQKTAVNQAKQGFTLGASSPVQTPRVVRVNGMKGVSHIDGSTSLNRPNMRGTELSISSPPRPAGGYGKDGKLTASEYEAEVRARAANRAKTKGFVGPMPEDISKRPSSPFNGKKHWTNAQEATKVAAGKEGASFGLKMKDLGNNISRFTHENNFGKRIAFNIGIGAFTGGMGSATGMVGSVAVPGSIEQNGGVVRGAVRGAMYGALLSAGQAAGGGLVHSQLGKQHEILGSFGKMTKGWRATGMSTALMTAGAFSSGFNVNLTNPTNPMR